MSLPQEKLDEIRTEAEKHANDEYGRDTRYHPGRIQCLRSFEAGAILYAEKLEAVTRDRDELSIEIYHVRGYVDEWRTACEGRRLEHDQHLEDKLQLRNNIQAERQYSDKLRDVLLFYAHTVPTAEHEYEFFKKRARTALALKRPSEEGK